MKMKYPLLRSHENDSDHSQMLSKIKILFGNINAPRLFVFTCFILCAFTINSYGQLTFTAVALTQTQNFNASATTALPAGWTIDTKNFGTGASVTDVTATSLTSTSSGSAYKFISGADYSIGFLNSGSFTTPNNITGQLVNNTGATITSLAVTFNLKKYRNGSRQWNWTFYGGNTLATVVNIPAGNYNFLADAANGNGIFPPQTTGIPTITIPVSIPNGGSYYFKWTMTGVGGSTNGQALGLDDVSVTATIPTPCAVPTGLAANNITTTTADLSWGTVVGAVGYEYIVDQSAATPVVAGTPTVSTTYNPTGLTPATAYYLHVRTNCGASFSAWSTALLFTTLTPCPTPTNLTAGNITTTTADLSWNTVAGALNYEYIVDQNPATPVVPGTVTATTSYNATTLTPATTYYLHVRANCGSPNYSAWITVSFTTLTPCPDPTGLAVNNITTTTADLSWNTVAGALNYEYIVDQNPATPVVPGTVTATTSYNATILTPATTYYLHVRANCGTPNYSAWVTVSFTTLTPCPDPTGLTANNITTTTADLSWNTLAGALNYEYIVDQNPATPVVPGTVTATTSYNATVLTPATTYYLHVRANCGTPNYSAWVTVSFTTLTPCPDPTGLTANNITTTTADLSWNTVAGALNYEYIVDQNPATPVVPGTVTATTSYNATSLTPTTAYYLHVRANCGTPNYSVWVTVSFTTLTPCPDPTGLAANNISTTTADLSWNTVAGALNYEYIVDQNPATPVVPGTVTVATIFNATGLTPATTYYMHIRANCGTPNYSAWVTSSFTTLTPCTDPTGLTASLVTNISALLSWDSLAGGPTYEYTIDQLPAAPLAAGTPTTNATYTASGLSPATTYYLHVRSDCGGNNLSNWITVPFTTMNTVASMLVGWNVDNLSGYGPSPYAATTPPPSQVIASGLLRGSNITVPLLPAQATDDAWGGMGFYGTSGPYVANTQQDCIDNNAFLYFTVKSQPGYTVSLSSFDMFFGRYGIASPENVTVQYGIDSANFVDLANSVHAGTPNNTYYSYPTLDLSAITALQQVTSGHTIYFRIIPVYSGNDTATAAWYIYNGNTNAALYDGADIFLNGNFDLALPLELVSFTGFAGQNSAGGNKLTWVTANEQNIKDFALERSYDAKAFNTIATVAARSNTSSQSVYQYSDKESTASHTFYRLKIYDENGFHKYSKVIELGNANKEKDINLYPNPVHSTLFVSDYDPSEAYTIKVIDVLGREQVIKPNGNKQQGVLSIDVSNLAGGVYLLQIASGNSETTRSIRFVKQ